MSEPLQTNEMPMQKYTSCVLSLEKTENINRRNRDDVDYYLASEVDARIAELKWCLQEAMQWNWMEEDLPEDLVERCEKALSL